MFPIKWFLIGLLMLVAVIVLESWRQSRKLKRPGSKSDGRPSFIGVGMLELQGLLQPDRKVEYMKDFIHQFCNDMDQAYWGQLWSM